MSNNKLVVGASIDSTEFKDGIDVMKDQVEQLKNKVKTLSEQSKAGTKGMKGMSGSDVLQGFGKLAGKIGAVLAVLKGVVEAAKGSYKVFSAITSVVGGFGDAIQNLFAAIADGDWKPFLQGMDDATYRASRANKAVMDLMRNTMIHEWKVKDAQANMEELKLVWDNKLSTPKEVQAALDKADQVLNQYNEATNDHINELTETIANELSAIANISVKNIDFDKVQKAVDNMVKDKEMYKYENAFEEYTRLLNELNDKKELTDFTKDANRNKYEKQYLEAIIATKLHGIDTEKYTNILTQLRELADLRKDSTGEKASFITARNAAQTDLTDNKYGQLETSEKPKVEVEPVIKPKHELKDMSDFMKGFSPEIPLDFVIPNAEELMKNINTGVIEDIRKKAAQMFEEMMEKAEATADVVGNLGSVFGNLGGVVGGSAGALLSFFGTALQGAADVIPVIQKLIAAKQAEALASGTAEAAKVQFPGNIPAILSIISTILGVFASFPKFANGGIMRGSTTIGDYGLARVNSGEMVLNTTQQNRLFNLLNGGVPSSTGYIIERDWRINGDTLVGTINNYERIHNRLRNK